MDLNLPIVVPPRTLTSSFTLDETMAGQTLVVTSASAVTVTIPTGLPLGFAVTIIQGGAGVITFTPASGVTRNNVNGHTRSGGQYTIQGIILAIAGQAILSGQTAA